MKPKKIMAPARNNTSSSSSSKKFLPYLAFLAFMAIFVFKVDIFISESLSGSARFKVESSKRQIINIRNNGTFQRNFLVRWGENNADMLEDGDLLSLKLDKSSGAGLESKKEFLFAKIDMKIKLILGDEAGSTYYLSSEVEHHDEIIFKFFGNSTGNPYSLHTNVFSQGLGEREQVFFLWFDPTLDFHTYTILWNPKCIIFFVDNIPIREFKNMEKFGVPFPIARPMRVYLSIWKVDELDTLGGRVKADYESGPFTASYSNYSPDGCIWSFRARRSSCTRADFLSATWLNLELDSGSRSRMKSMQRDHMIYDYCRDKRRFSSNGLTSECRNNE